MEAISLYSGSRTEDYPLVREQIRQLWEPGLPLVSKLSNCSALLADYLDRTNWVGFYLWDADRHELYLGPFQGKVACTRIASGKGVCGTASKTLRSQLVSDVHQFPGHIACDSTSLSEIVIPLICEGQLVGVLDIDSPELARFDQLDLRELEAIGTLIAENWGV